VRCIFSSFCCERVKKGNTESSKCETIYELTRRKWEHKVCMIFTLLELCRNPSGSPLWLQMRRKFRTPKFLIPRNFQKNIGKREYRVILRYCHDYTPLGATSNYRALSLIFTLYKSLHIKSSPACSVFTSRSLATASYIGDSSASCTQVLSSQPPVQNSNLNRQELNSTADS
jgi:hypothetical protein